jgi:hypothetical protein
MTVKNRKSLKSFTTNELINYLDDNESIEMIKLAAICSEILRRMNQQSPLFKETKNDLQNKT